MACPDQRVFLTRLIRLREFIQTPSAGHFTKASVNISVNTLLVKNKQTFFVVKKHKTLLKGLFLWVPHSNRATKTCISFTCRLLGTLHHGDEGFTD